MTPEQQEMFLAAHAAKASGFKRVEIAPEDLIALLDRIAELERDDRADAKMGTDERAVSAQDVLCEPRRNRMERCWPGYICMGAESGRRPAGGTGGEDPRRGEARRQIVDTRAARATISA